MITGVEHIAIYAKDTKALTDWYVQMFDGKIVHDNGKGNYFVAFSNGSLIEISPNEAAENQPTAMDEAGIRHIALATDDLEAAAAKVRASGVEILKEAVVNAKGVGTMFFRDPDGNILHLISRVEPLY